MHAPQLDAIADWFARYVALFRATTAEEQRNYDLKIHHTWQVRDNIDRLTGELGLPSGERALAAALALCHDVGRFPQYRDHGTFNDAVSTDHAALAVRTLQAEGVLEDLDAGERGVLLQGIALHNAFALPGGLEPQVERGARLLRDADKLDIWRVLIEHCRSEASARASAVTWGLPETGRCSAGALAELAAGRMVERRFIETVDDFKLLQLSWVFDLNYRPSFVMLAERGYVETLLELLPAQPGCVVAAQRVREFLRRRQEEG